ncbi:MAG: class II aldolase/adducin family protein [Candidatus Omnitrophica bacterium]|nr:class II aldolase/adducin family protein [Candidatus Omnitrophota bacterium]
MSLINLKLRKVEFVEGEFGTSVLNNEIVNNIQNNAVIVRGHGSFTIGDDLRKAFVLSCALETSSKLLYYKSIYKSIKLNMEV